MIKEITVPEVGEKIESGQVVAILVKVGDRVEVDDGIIEFETDKAVVEIPSPVKGTITEVLAKDGDTVKIGAVIARIDTEGAAAVAAPEPPSPPVTEPTPPPEPAPAPEPTPAQAPEATPSPKPAAPVARKAPPVGVDDETPPLRKPAPASPSVRRLARELGADIFDVAGTGPGGRITEGDVKAHVKQIVAGLISPTAGQVSVGERPMPDFSRWGEIESEEISTVRRLTAQGTSTSWNIVPHVTQFDKADITGVMEFIKTNGPAVEKAGGKLTLTPILMKVLAHGLVKNPRFNASFDLHADKIILKKYVHIGLAVDTERGLLVPVVRDVDRKSITALAVEVMDLAGRTRNKRIQPDELEGGTFTISNQGGIGGTDFTPIVLWPQVAILGVSRASVQPVYIDGEFRPRTVLPLSLSYDHRIIDGADAARFLRWVVRTLEQPLLLHLD